MSAMVPPSVGFVRVRASLRPGSRGQPNFQANDLQKLAVFEDFPAPITSDFLEIASLFWLCLFLGLVVVCFCLAVLIILTPTCISRERLLQIRPMLPDRSAKVSMPLVIVRVPDLRGMSFPSDCGTSALVLFWPIASATWSEGMVLASDARGSKSIPGEAFPAAFFLQVICVNS